MAAKYITEHGYNILERNYNGRFGEIDIIAHKASVLIFFEVKYRSSMNFGDPSEAVDVRKQRKYAIRRLNIARITDIKKIRHAGSMSLQYIRIIP